MKAKEKNNLLWIGTIVNTHGLKGELRILSNSESIEERFKIGNTLFTETEQFEINSMRIHKNFILLTFKKLNDINQVEHLKGSKIYVPREDEDIYLIDLIGFKVINDNKDIIGVVHSFSEMGSYESMKILQENKEITNIPFLKQFIIKVEQKNKEILVKVPTEFYEHKEIKCRKLK